MSLYSHHFDILPKPSRGILSTGPEATRAMLPDFDSVSQLSQFVRGLVICEYSTAVFTQLKVGAAIVAFLVLVLLLVLIHRLCTHKFTIFKIIRRSTGSLIVPSTVVIFALMQAIFGGLFAGFLVVLVRAYDTHAIQPTNILLWVNLPYLSFINGLIWLAWGTFFATPNALLSNVQRGDNQGTKLSRLILRPSIVNWMALVVIPCIVCVAVIIPTVIANTHLQKATQLEREWQSLYSKQVDFSLQMVQSSQMIYYQVIKASTAATISYIVWAILFFLSAVAFTIISCNFISTVQKELDRDAAQNGGNDDDDDDDKNNSDNNKENNIINTTADTPASNARTVEVADRGSDPSSQSMVATDLLSITVLAKEEDDSTLKSACQSPRERNRKQLKAAKKIVQAQILFLTPACFFWAIITILLSSSIAKLDQADTLSEQVHQVGIYYVVITWLVISGGAGSIGAVAFREFQPFLSACIPTFLRGIGSGSSVKQDSRSGGGVISKPVGSNNKNCDTRTLRKAKLKHSQSTFFETQSVTSLLSNTIAGFQRRGARHDIDVPQVSSNQEVVLTITEDVTVDESYEEQRSTRHHRRLSLSIDHSL